MRTRVLMKKRSQVPRMVQQDLFATIRPPAPPQPTDGAVEAAAHYESVRRSTIEQPAATVGRRTRSQAGGVPFATGPVSDATGGPLSAEEAERVISKQTIRCAGYQFSDGMAFCKGCFEPFDSIKVASLHALHGHRDVLYGGAEYKGGLDCHACHQPIAP